MKKFTITMIIIASILIISGIGLIVVSSAFFPWNANFYQIIEKFKYYDGRIVKKSIEASTATLKTIDISMINEKIEVIKGGDKIVITYTENINYTYKIIETGDKISIKEESKHNFWPIEHWFWFHSDQNLVLIQIPDKMKLNTLTLKSINGMIETNSVKIANANISIHNGTIKLIDSQIDQVSASSTNGRCYSIGNTIKDLDFRTINGLVSVDSGDITKIKLHAVNGKVKATGLPGKITDYNINCRTVNGNVHINGKKVSSRGSYKSLVSGHRSIDIDTLNGKIKIETKIK
jgi:DUF4097 and DUF4098 domain-containing protein YvlB